MSQIETVTDDPAYRHIVESVLPSALAEIGVSVQLVDFGKEDRNVDYSWVCFVVDPQVESKIAPLTESSSRDHFALTNPNGVLRVNGQEIEAIVYSIEVSHEAAMHLRDDDGRPVLFSPVMSGQAVAIAKFNYRSIGSALAVGDRVVVKAHPKDPVSGTPYVGTVAAIGTKRLGSGEEIATVTVDFDETGVFAAESATVPAAGVRREGEEEPPPVTGEWV